MPNVLTEAKDILSPLSVVVQLILRLLLAAILGFAIGFERKTRSKEAGIRTHIMVSMGACLYMLVSKYGFSDYVSTVLTGNSTPGSRIDGARIVAQVVSGIGFLGAGMIVYSKGSLHGLTTAAGIWATAAVGIAAGAGGNVMMILSIVMTALILCVHLLFRLPIKLFRTKATHMLQLQFRFEEGAIDKIKALFHTESLYRMRIQIVDGQKMGTALLRTANIPADNMWQTIMDENPFITAMEYSEQEW